jgi:hypothetical protein
MTKDELKNLRYGDLVRSKASGASYIVTANYGGRVTAVRTADLTNPDEWELVQKAPIYPGESQIDIARRAFGDE